MESVSIRLIKSNPFQARQSFDRETIKQLADEIKQQGFWDHALRARRVDGHYELVFGHRRLEALRLLGHTKINLEVVELDDQGMAMQSMVENLQRQGLTDVEKANGIKRLLTVGSRPPTREKVAEMLGYSERSLDEFLMLADLDHGTKKVIEKTGMSRTLVSSARQVGGPEFVRMAAQENLTRKEIREIQTQVAKVPEDARPKLEEKLKSGKLTKSSQVAREARKLSRPKSSKMPPELYEVVGRYTLFIKGWRKELRQIQPYIPYLEETDPDILDIFRKETRGLIEDLQKLL
jgi:ParB family chromosome partitioning protein